jgi:hypothetical protein
MVRIIVAQYFLTNLPKEKSTAIRCIEKTLLAKVMRREFFGEGFPPRAFARAQVEVQKLPFRAAFETICSNPYASLPKKKNPVSHVTTGFFL